MARKVSVTINGKEYVSQESKKAGDSLKKLGGTSDKINAAIKVGFVAAAAAVTAAVASITKAVNSTIKLTDNIDKMSQRIGVSRQAFQEWDFILSQNGMNISQLQTGIKTLSSAAEEASRGVVTYSRTFKTLGVSVVDSNGSLKDQETLLFDTIYALAEVENTTQRTALATDLLGRSATDLAPLLNSGADSIEELRDMAHDLGLVLSDETVDAGVKLTDTIDQMKRTFSALMATALTPVIGDINDLGQMLLEQTKAGGGLSGFVELFVKGFVWISNNVQKISAVIGFSFQVIGALAEWAGERIAGFAEEIGLVDALKKAINFTIEIGGEIYDSIKTGLETGDWSGFFSTSANVLNAGIGISVGLHLVRAFGVAIGGGFTAIASAMSGKLGLLTSGVTLGGAAATIGLVSVAVGLVEAAGTGNWDEFGQNLATAAVAGLLAAGLTKTSAGVWVFSIGMALKIGSFLEEWTNAHLTQESAQMVADAIKGWWNNNVKDPLAEFWWSYGKSIWEGIVAGIRSFFRTVDLVGATVDLIRLAFNQDKGVEEVGEETGGNLIQGLVNGIEKSKSFLAEKWEKLVDLWHTIWDEHSPSGVGIDSGFNLVLGFIQGIEDPALRGKLQVAFEKLVAAFGGSAQLDADDILGGISGDGSKESEEAKKEGALSGIIEKFTGLIEPLSSIQAILDPISVILSGVMDVLGPAIDQVFAPFVGILRIIGKTLGSVLAPILNAISPVIEAIGEGFVWVYNTAIVPFANGIIWVANKLKQGIAKIVNGVIDGINWALGWAGVNIGKIQVPADAAGTINKIDYKSLVEEGSSSSSSSYSGSAPGSSTSVQQLNINVYQYFQGNVIGDGGMESVGEYVVRAMQAYAGAGGNVKVVAA
jgi:hypothetical protein